MSKGRQHQRGYIFSKSGSWYLRYRQYEVQADGSRKLVQRCRKLVDNQGPYRSKKAVKVLADEFLAPLNNGTTTIASCMSIDEFFEKKYLPFVTEKNRPSTVSGYKQVWNRHLKNRLLLPLREFRTVDCERLLHEIAHERDYASNTLQKVKFLMSGIIRYAIRTGILNGTNPVREACIPSTKPREETHAYNLKEIKKMLEILPQPERSVVAILGFAGLRKGEARCLQPSAYNGKCLKIESSAWESYVTVPKGKVGSGVVPLIPTAARVLDDYLATSNPKNYIFESSKGGPANIDYMVSTVIRPKLLEAGLPWYGLHALRRGLATNLHELGIDDKVIQVILRHSNAAITRKFYIKNKAVDPRSMAAMEALEAALCNQCATTASAETVGYPPSCSNQTVSEVLSHDIVTVRTGELLRSSLPSGIRTQQLSSTMDHRIRAPFRESASNCATDVQLRESRDSELVSDPSREATAKPIQRQMLCSNSPNDVAILPNGSAPGCEKEQAGGMLVAQCPQNSIPNFDCLDAQRTALVDIVESHGPADSSSGQAESVTNFPLPTQPHPVPASLNARYCREKLYEEVWTYPMRTLAPHYGVSDRALRKTCDCLHIPVPPQGYWNKVAAGKDVTPRPALPQVQVVDKYKNRRAMTSCGLEEQKSIAAQIASDVTNGETLKSACRKAGVSYDSYRPWYRRHLREAPHPVDSDGPHTQVDRVASLVMPTIMTDRGSSVRAENAPLTKPCVSEKLLTLHDRKKLYEEVWRSPMSLLAKQYGRAMQTVRRWCEQLYIPVPVAGHWARLRHNWPVQERPPLPEVQIGERRNKEWKSNLYSPEQIAMMLERISDACLSGSSLAMACSEVGIAVTTYRRWRNRFQQPAD